MSGIEPGSGPTGLIGLDVGTTRVKAVAFDLDGTVLATADLPTPWRRVDGTPGHGPGGVEMVPAELAASIRAVVRRACAPLARAAGLGATGMGESGVLTVSTSSRSEIDALTPIRAWHDQRGDVRSIRERFGAEGFERATGMPLNSQPSLPKILRLRAEYPASAAARRFWSVPEWAVRILGGVPGSELSLASRTGLLDALAGTAWSGAVDLLGTDLLGEPQPAGTPVGVAAPLDGAPQLTGAVLAVGGHDHQCAALAAGAARPGTLFDSLGTAEALVRFAEADGVGPEAIGRLTAAGLTVGRTVIAGRLCILAGLRTGMELERAAAALGATGPEQRAALADDPRWAEAVEHILDGATPALRAITDAVGPHTAVLATGGWLHDRVVLEAKVRRLPGLRPTPAAIEAGAAGAAYLAAAAAGLMPRADRLTGPPWPNLLSTEHPQGEVPR